MRDLVLGGQRSDLGHVLGITDKMARVGQGETSAANDTDIAGGEVAATPGPAEQRIRDLVSFFRHEAEEQSKSKHGKKGNAPKPAAAEQVTVESLGLEGWNREELRNGAVALGLTQGKTGERDRLLPLIQAHLAAEPNDAVKIVGHKPTPKTKATQAATTPTE